MQFFQYYFSFRTDIWACPRCTLENPNDVNKCQACDGPKPGSDSNSVSPPEAQATSSSEPEPSQRKNGRKNLKRQTSAKVESVREDDVSRALTQWTDIVKICKEV